MATILADDIFKSIFLNENVRILIWISLKFVPKDPIDNKSALFQVMAWRQTGITWSNDDTIYRVHYITLTNEPKSTSRFASPFANCTSALMLKNHKLFLLAYQAWLWVIHHFYWVVPYICHQLWKLLPQTNDARWRGNNHVTPETWGGGY